MSESFPFNHHPCWSEDRSQLWERIHLPIARTCNLKCAFCETLAPGACHTSFPGVARSIMTPTVALERLEKEINSRPALKIIAVSGPGDPLFSKGVLDTLLQIREKWPDKKLCLSTNGTSVSEKIRKVDKLKLDTISVSMHAITPETASKIYLKGFVDGRSLSGYELGEKVIDNQLRGIEHLAEMGVHVKVNTVLIPHTNNDEIPELALQIATAGAKLQNIIPLIPSGQMKHLNGPTKQEIQLVRRKSLKYIRQFIHCKQCRSDVVGIPGDDTIL